MSQSFDVTGTVTISDTGAFSLIGHVVDGPQPPIPPTPIGGDAIDLAQVVLTSGSPDVRGWPIGSHLTSFQLNPGHGDGDHSYFDFDKRFGAGAWPFVPGPEGGEIQYTIWVCCQILGVWYACGSILCISRSQGDNYSPTGPILKVGQLPDNWYYFAGSPLAGYQPQPGEPVAWFLTSGVQRRNDIHAITERTQVVIAPFTAGTFGF